MENNLLFVNCNVCSNTDGIFLNSLSCSFIIVHLSRYGVYIDIPNRKGKGGFTPNLQIQNKITSLNCQSGAEHCTMYAVHFIGGYILSREPIFVLVEIKNKKKLTKYQL